MQGDNLGLLKHLGQINVATDCPSFRYSLWCVLCESNFKHIHFSINIWLKKYNLNKCF